MNGDSTINLRKFYMLITTVYASKIAVFNETNIVATMMLVKPSSLEIVTLFLNNGSF
ncbi:hypothetical protein GCM10008935_18160 [Alkalibacillus silvisoli]|uniref:Uncharacterized protein n=1 Tax=Alkalibacillus silvisoli TaxID=392823 RepID=A0ABP3JSB1_9BACI